MAYTVDITQDDFDFLMENHYVKIDLSKYPDWVFRSPCPLYIVPQWDFDGKVPNDTNQFYYLSRGLEEPTKGDISITGRGMYNDEELEAYLKRIHNTKSPLYLRDYTDRDNKLMRLIFPEMGVFQKLQR